MGDMSHFTHNQVVQLGANGDWATVKKAVKSTHMGLWEGGVYNCLVHTANGTDQIIQR